MKYLFLAGGIALVLLMGPVLTYADEPTITGATNSTTEATSTNGVSVTFSVSASDTDASALIPSCSPASGTLFALGTTTVTCTATSTINIASTTTAHFDVGVVDTTPPAIIAPADQGFATTTIPAIPTLVFATAHDTVDANPTITVSTTTFAVGTTTVTWTATDASGNRATTTSHVGISLVINTAVDVPANCNATDTDGVVHGYQAASSTAYIAMCAVEAALGNGSIASAQFSNAFPSIGLFLTTINGAAADPNSQYWALYQNGNFASLGLSQLPIAASDTLMLQLHDFSDNNLGSQVTLAVHSLIATTTEAVSAPSAPSAHSPSSGGGSGSYPVMRTSFNVSAALAYLAGKQHADGSFDSPFLTDWAALAFAAQDPGAAKTNLRNYLLTASPALESATDYERHAMALMALGINPYTGTATDSITPIVNAFDGAQIGNVSLDNDDIFALFPLLSAGYAASDPIIQKTVAFIISRQAANGSWDASPDLTAAAIQALSQVKTLPDVPTALSKAANYLRVQQQANGGWGNSFSTSWALQAITALGESPENWAPGGYNPKDYLASLQQSDGGIESISSSLQTRTWATEYAIPAISGRMWPSLLMAFSKPGAAASAGIVLGASTSTIAAALSAATSTIATSTPTVATSTPLVAATTSTPVITIAQHTTIESKPAGAPAKTEIQKTKVPIKVTLSTTQPTTAPSAPAAQTAVAIEAAPKGGFLSMFWQSIVSFFGHFF